MHYLKWEIYGKSSNANDLIWIFIKKDSLEFFMHKLIILAGFNFDLKNRFHHDSTASFTMNLSQVYFMIGWVESKEKGC